MIFYITLKDIKSFFMSEKKVFIWLLICMICGSFVLNYSYSFARYRGELRELALGATAARYKIGGTYPSESAETLLKRISEGNFPEVKDYQLFGESESGQKIIGSSYISQNSAAFTGMWVEGYAKEIENTGENVCAVDISFLDYGDRLKMTGEAYVLDGEEFTIRGVYYSREPGLVIFADKFTNKYPEFRNIWITFSERLTDDQEREFKKTAREIFPDCGLTDPPKPGEAGADTVKSNEIQYSAIIIMLVVCLVSLIKYWQAVNLPAYTVYWINGAANSVIMRVALCESLILCATTYLIGLGLNAISRLFFTRNAALTLNDILIGFGMFFGTFAIFTLINTAKICKQFKVTNVRRD